MAGRDCDASWPLRDRALGAVSLVFIVLAIAGSASFELDSLATIVVT